MLAYAAKLKKKNPNARAAVLGGGLLGLEAGKAVMDMGLEPHIVEFASKLMPRQLDSRSSQVLQLKLESIGLNIHLSKATNQILGDTCYYRNGVWRRRCFRCRNVSSFCRN